MSKLIAIQNLALFGRSSKSYIVESQYKTLLSGILTQGVICANTILGGDTVNLCIESNLDGYACTFGNETTVTGGFDFKLTSIDPDYVYVGMFAARNADITYSDIKLVIDGIEVSQSIIN